MSISKKKLSAAAIAALVALTLTSCGSEEAAACPQVKEGVLTIATDEPAYGPWFDNNDPANGKGYEAAVAYAVADELGYSKDKVEWVRVPFGNVVAPGCRNFDFDINQFSITDERAKVIDFSTGYYDVTQAIITVAGSKIANAKSIADLQGAKLGAQVGTTSYATITDVIKPTQEASVFDTNDVAKQALANGQIDGLVVDLPTAFYLSGVEVPNGLIVGQLPSTGAGDQFGLLLTKGSKLTSCVSGAVDAITADGTLASITDKWLATDAGAPVFKP